jgi:hypothetical protein
VGWRLRKRMKQNLVRMSGAGGGYRAFVREHCKGRKGRVTPVEFRRLGEQYKNLPASERDRLREVGKSMALALKHSSRRVEAPEPRGILTEGTCTTVVEASGANHAPKRGAKAKREQEIAQIVHEWVAEQQPRVEGSASSLLSEGSCLHEQASSPHSEISMSLWCCTEVRALFVFV